MVTPAACAIWMALSPWGGGRGGGRRGEGVGVGRWGCRVGEAGSPEGKLKEVQNVHLKIRYH